MLPFHLLFLHRLFPRRAVPLGPNSGAADAASGAGKADCGSGQNQQLLGVAKWWQQPHLSVRGLAAAAVGWENEALWGTDCCCHSSPGQQWQLLSVPKPLMSSRSSSSGGPLSPAVRLSAAHPFPIPREPRHTPKGFRNS